MRYSISTLVFLFFLLNHTHAQSGAYGMVQYANKIEIPFEMKNNLMLVDVTFSHFFPLKFIFDTGAENTILSKKEVTDILRVPYEREFKVMGADMKTELKAYLVRNIYFEFGSRGVIPRHSMLVLDEDYFRFEEVAGLKIHGIIGADVFRGMVVKINYDRRVITLIRKKKFKPPKNYESVPIEVNKNKAYINTQVSILEGKPRPVKLLLDSGAMVSLLLNTDDEDEGLSLPPDILTGQIAAGLGGFIDGYLGRVSNVSLGNVECREILANFQELADSVDVELINNRNGILGNRLLKKFHLIIDYTDGVLYYKPNKKFKVEDDFDKSGLVIIAADIKLNKFIVHGVLEGSPADLAGLQKGDRVLRINSSPASLMTLETIGRKLRKKEGKKIKMVVKRNGQVIKFEFRLKKLI